MIKYSILPIALFTAILTGCTINTGNNVADEILIAKGEVIIKEHGLDEDFNSIDVDGVFSIEITQGDENKVTVEAQENIHKVLTFNVEDGLLNVGYKDGIAIKKVKNFKILIEAKEINTINFEGVGSLKFKKIDTDSLTVNADSVGIIELEGKTNYAKLNNNGVGKFEAKELKTKVADVTNNGVGGVSIYVSDAIKATNNGVGGISYFGEPKKRNIIKNGLGKIKDQGMH